MNLNKAFAYRLLKTIFILLLDEVRTVQKKICIELAILNLIRSGSIFVHITECFTHQIRHICRYLITGIEPSFLLNFCTS